MDQTEPLIIIGLGNVGANYGSTRHNLGFMVVDELAEQLHAGNFSTHSDWQVYYTEFRNEDRKIILAKPTTMMNLSGVAARALLHFYKVGTGQLWLIHDEIDLPFGTIRSQDGGSSAGHRGVESVIQHVGADFKRFRVGVANDLLRKHIDTEVFVLQPFTTTEREALGKVIQTAASKVRTALTEGFITETITTN